MNSTRTASILLAIATVWPSTARAAAPSPVAIEIDAKTLGSFEEGIVERVNHEAADDIADAGMIPATTASSKIAIVVEFVGGKKTSYAYRMVAIVDDEEIESSRASGTCEKCVQEDVVARIDAEIPAQLAAIGAARSSATPAPAAPVRPPTADATPPSSPSPDAKPRGIGALGKAGIALGVIGVAALGTGIGLALRPTRFGQDAADTERDTGRKTLAPGIALAVVGGAAIVAAIPLLVVDRRRAKRTARVTPILTPRWAGLGVSGHF